MMMRISLLLSLALLILTIDSAHSWSLSPPRHHQHDHATASSANQRRPSCNTNEKEEDASVDLMSSRRHLLQKGLTAAAALGLGLGGGSNVAAHAATTNVPTPDELHRLQLGHARVRYLLDHWDAVTEVCGTAIMSDTERRQVIRTEGGTQCSKTPLRVQEFMGYKSTSDPLFRADKLMVRAGPLVDPNDFEDYVDAVERYREKADQTALLAYTSSWGEANPNGGKEVIEEYLEQTKAQVVESERLLKRVLDYLHLPPLPPLQGKL